MPLSGSRGAKTVTAGINRVVIFLVCALLAGVAPVRLAAEPLFERTDLFLQGHDNVFQYRIPALVTTNRGTLLAVCDARIHRYGDPPNAIDQVLKRSFDNGRIWEPIKVIADYPDMASACDPCLLVDRHTGRNLGFLYVLP